jgi:hypothetical protein
MIQNSRAESFTNTDVNQLIMVSRHHYACMEVQKKKCMVERARIGPIDGWWQLASMWMVVSSLLTRLTVAWVGSAEGFGRSRGNCNVALHYMHGTNNLV